VRVLITGGAGFIGSHLCDNLLKLSGKITVIDNLSTGSIKNIKHLQSDIEVINGDIRNSSLVDSATKNVDVVLHMAAAVGVKTILSDPINSISTNFHGSETVLNAALKFEKRIIIASTSEIYGKNQKQPLSEDADRVIGSPQNLRWSYSDAKALEEAAAHTLFLKSNLRVTTIRLFNTVGPRQTGQYGMVIPNFVNSALNNNAIKIFGDGKQSRVFCHVDDVVGAIIEIIENDRTIGEVFNIGGENEISITDLAKFIISKTRSDSRITYVKYEDAYPLGFEDMLRRVPNIDKINAFTGWKPKKSLDQIIDDVVAYQSKEI
jgi:UDP-glucose 4-epimerase